MRDFFAEVVGGEVSFGVDAVRERQGFSETVRGTGDAGIVGGGLADFGFGGGLAFGLNLGVFLHEPGHLFGKLAEGISTQYKMKFRPGLQD